MFNSRLINTKVAGGGGGCTDIVDNYDPFGGNGVALYQLNGDATDVSGNYDGTATNVTYSTGVFGQAGVFNGSSSYIRNNSLSVNTASSWGVSFWAYSNSNNSYQRMVQFGLGGDVLILQKRGDNNKIRLYSEDTGSTNFDINGDVMNTGQWYHIVATGNGSNAYLYINNSKEYTSAIAGTFNFSDFYLGIRGGTSLEYFNGSIDQVRIFDTALTPLEIEALYTEELCICDGTVDTLDILGDGSCIATYQLDGNANDLSGNYSGTYNGSFIVGEFDLGLDCGTAAPYGLLTNLVSNSNIISHSFWVNFKDSVPPTVYFSLVTNAANSGGSVVPNSRYHILWDSSNNYFIVSVGNGGGWSDTNLTPSPSNAVSQYHGVNAWQNMVVVLNNGNIKIYLNTDLIINASFPIGNQTTSNYVGYGTYGPSSRIENFDQVRIFNKALSSGEVTTLYNETACTKVTRESGATQILGDSSCISYLKLDGNATDETGNYTTSVTEVDYGVGEFGQAGYFNQVYSSRIEYNAAILPANIFSVSMWMKVTNLSNNKWILTQYTGGVTGRFVFAYNDNGGLQISNGASNSGASITEGAIRNNIWQHIVLIKNGGSGWEIYVDNQSIGTWSNTSNIITNQNTVFGGNQNVTDRSIDGQLDNIRVFNKAISASEVTTLYNEGI